MRRITSKPRVWYIAGLSAVAVLLATSYGLKGWHRTEINTVDINQANTGINITGSVSSKKPSISNLQAKPGTKITAQSRTIDFKQVPANAASIRWQQTGENGVSLQVRTFNGVNWTPWTEAMQNDDRKDGTPQTEASTLILAQNIDRLEYRFNLVGSPNEPSAIIDLSAASLNAIDTSKGPDGRVGLLRRLAQSLRFSGKASAGSDAPRIISRAEWGSPEPESSPDWAPEYAPLSKAIIHHTATTEEPNSYAAVRAIWQYHRYGNGWGDIGYNYIIDSVGNIFQGRYYDQAYAKANSVDVTAGHAYRNNTGTTGIASIGNFQSANPPAAMTHAIGRITGYKLAPYQNADPLGSGASGQVMVGHRDVLSTACPGNNLHVKLPELRWIAHQYYERDSSMNKFDYSYVGQVLSRNDQSIPLTSHLKYGEDVMLSVRLKNTGTDTWKNSGQFVTRLATARPNDRQSRFYDPSWISSNRMTTFDSKLSTDNEELATNEILPGETAIFDFKIRVPEIAATVDDATLFNEYYGLVQDGKSWFLRDVGLYQPYIVKNNVYSWEWRGQSVFTDGSKSQQIPWGQPLDKNQRYYLQVSAKNTGSATWSSSQMRLGTSSPQDRVSQIRDSSWISSNRAVATIDQSVAPGETTEFEFWIKTPDVSSFSSDEYFKPVNEGVTWLNDNWLHFPIKTK